MRFSLPGDLLISANFVVSSMVLQNHNTIAALTINSTNTVNNASRGSTLITGLSSTMSTNRMNHQRPVVDLLVAIIAVPVLILCALQLEKNLHDMANSPESRWLVFALGIGMLIVSVIICGYVTHRMGVCIWAGPIDETASHRSSHERNMRHINSQNDILRIVDSLPPSYDSVVKFDIPPPPYDCLMIDIEQSKDQSESTQKPSVSSNSLPTTLHI
ncbi:uncharacterized protein ACN427_010627 isoform 1-T1 [Glossina fuscipes fuscipes]